MSMTADRRRFLALAAAAPFAGLAASRALAEDAATCIDPAKVPLAQQGLRKSLQFQPVAADAKKRCGGCAFFKATQAGCGTCQILNGPVAATSSCASFAAKPGA